MSDRKRVPQALNNSEQLALLRQPNPRAPTGLRNLCIITLMLKAGLRVNEIIELKNTDIDWMDGKISIRGSRSAKSRTLWLEKGDLALLERWRELKPEEGGGLLFTTLDGSKLNDRYLREMIKRLSCKAGIKKDVYPHLLRYTFAVNLMREIKSIRLLQQALGHRDQSATQMYINLLFNELSEPEFSPEGGVRSGMPVQETQQASEKTVWNNMVNGREEGTIKYDKDHLNFSKNNNQDHANSEDLASKKNHQEEDKNGEVNNNKTGANEDNEPTRYEPEELAGKQDEKQTEKEIEEPAGEQTEKHTEEQNETPEKEKEEEPKISIVAESGYEDGQSKSRAKKPIPPIKCCHCNYILSYQDDCPKCGTAFNQIVKHWRRNLW